MKSVPRRARVVLCVLVLAVVGYTVIPMPLEASVVCFDAIAIVAVVGAFGGVAHHRPVHRRGWVLVISGFGGWIVADLVRSTAQDVWHLTTFPTPATAVYLASQVVLGLGVLLMFRSRQPAPDATALLDALILATGGAVVGTVAVIAAFAGPRVFTPFGNVVSSAFPIANLLLATVMAQLWAAPGPRSPSYRLLMTALVLVLAGYSPLNLSLVDGVDLDRRSSWPLLASYVVLSAAAWAGSMTTLSEPAPDRTGASSKRRLAVLAAGLMLPTVVLLVDGATGDGVRWPVIGVGSLVVSVLVLMRMSRIVRTVEVQAAQLATLARLDELTGAPNRRTWDHELLRACAASRERGSALCLAIVDLDHFKEFNDAFGHQAGDLLLREAVAGWIEALGPDAFLARYGGDEFTILLPGLDLAEAHTMIQRLRAVTPHGQTISAGVSRWDPSTEPTSALAAADTALYEAKGAGRNRVVAHGAGQTTARASAKPAPSARGRRRTGPADRRLTSSETGRARLVQPAARAPPDEPRTRELSRPGAASRRPAGLRSRPVPCHNVGTRRSTRRVRRSQGCAGALTGGVQGGQAANCES